MSSFVAVFNNLKVGRKLAVLSAVFAVPVAFLAWLLVAQSLKDIHFAEKERDGGAYLAGLAGLEIDLVAGWYAGQPASALRPAVDRLAQLERGLTGELGTAELFAATNKAVSDFSASGKVGDDGAAFTALMKAVRALIGRVGDSSNLILDPDLDSFYAMDISVLKLPELVDVSSQVLDSAERLLKLKTVEVAQVAELLTRLGSYQGVMEGVAASLDSGYRGNTDGRMRPALDPVYVSFKTAAQSYDTALRALAKGGASASARPDSASLRRLQAAVVKEANTLWKATIAEMDRLLVQRIAGFKTKLWLSLGAAFLVELLALALAFAVVRSVSWPLGILNGAMGTMAGGSREVEVAFVERRDEVGDMARSLQVFKDNLIGADRLAEEQKRRDEARAVRAKRIEDLCSAFDVASAAAVKSVAAAASQMQSSAAAMSATAEETTRQAAAVAAASEQASANVETVASAAEELSSSIGEISRQVSQASQIAAAAVREAEQTNVKVQGLAQAANKIGEVVALITDIAEQTNLLALNATIEAARAGDAGKGFAVVASEVKNLANQTAKATEEIGAQISGIQSATQEAVTAIESIGKTIGQINEVASGVASAVEEQGAATQEIARNVEQAAAGTQEVSSNIAGVSQAANDTGAAAEQIQSAAGELSVQSEKLSTEVEKFLVDVRSA